MPHNCGGNRRNDSSRPTSPRLGTPTVFCHTGSGLALSFVPPEVSTEPPTRWSEAWATSFICWFFLIALIFGPRERAVCRTLKLSRRSARFAGYQGPECYVWQKSRLKPESGLWQAQRGSSPPCQTRKSSAQRVKPQFGKLRRRRQKQKLITAVDKSAALQGCFPMHIQLSQQ